MKGASCKQSEELNKFGFIMTKYVLKTLGMATSFLFNLENFGNKKP